MLRRSRKKKLIKKTTYSSLSSLNNEKQKDCTKHICNVSATLPCKEYFLSEVVWGFFYVLLLSAFLCFSFLFLLLYYIPSALSNSFYKNANAPACGCYTILCRFCLRCVQMAQSWFCDSRVNVFSDHRCAFVCLFLRHDTLKYTRRPETILIASRFITSLFPNCIKMNFFPQNYTNKYLIATVWKTCFAQVSAAFP